MGIYKNNKPAVAIYYHQLPIKLVYIGNKLVWPGFITLLLSCYANGYWIDENPWTDYTLWNDNIT